MGYLACQKARVQVREGNVGAGAGATVGKIKGVKYGTKSGLGSWSITLESGLTIGAIAAVNALGDVIDPDQGKIIAGVRGKEGFPGTPQVWEQEKNGILNPRAGTNTTIAVVASNARLDKAGATKVAQMAQNGLVKVINPVHTMFDGDTVFALATGELTADINLVGYLAAEVLSQAILRAVYKAETIQGIKCWKD